MKRRGGTLSLARHSVPVCRNATDQAIKGSCDPVQKVWVRGEQSAEHCSCAWNSGTTRGNGGYGGEAPPRVPGADAYSEIEWDRHGPARAGSAEWPNQDDEARSEQRLPCPG